MRTAAAATALLLLLASSAYAETENLPSAIMIEWTVANCPPEGIPTMLVAMSEMVINSATEDEADIIREVMRKGVADNYPDIDAACADLKARIANP